MIPYLGDFAEDETLYIAFNTFDSTDPSASVTITNLVDADIKVHKDGSITQIVTDGATIVIDFDSITGNHLITIDTSAHADYSTGSDYHVRIEGTTVDGATINAWIGHFSIENRFSRLTAARAQVLDDWINAGRLDAILDSIKQDTSIVIVGKINTIDSIVDAIVVDTGTTLDTKINDIQGATFSSATDSLEAIRDQGDSAWVTGGGGSISDILNIYPLVPISIDLANTATVRLGILLINSLDDLPSTAEITPGTISIDRKAIGGTSWSSILSDVACSEIAGLIYYDEVFDSGTGYAEGDSIRVTFKSQKITVSSNDYEIIGTTGRMFYTEVRQTMRGTEGANTTTPPTVAAIADAVQDEPIEDHDTQGTAGWAVALSVYAGSDGPGIYVDSGASNTNTVVGTDGTEINPVSTFAAARTIADALGLKIYYLEGNSDATLAATHLDWEFIGLGSVEDNIVNLGSQDVSRSLFRNLALEGTQGGSGRITARDCALQDPGAGDTTLHIFAERCGFVDRIQVDASNDNVFDSCYSLVAGTGTPVIEATGAAGTIALRHYSGGIEFESLSASHNVTVEGFGQVIFNANCNVNANVSVRMIGTITDNTGGMSSLTEVALINIDKINIECDTALSDYDPPTRTEATSDKDAIITQGDSAWATATGFSTHSAADVWAVGTRALTDKAGFALSAAGVDAILDEGTDTSLVGNPGSLRELPYFMTQMHRNKLNYDKATDDMILYEDDSTTPKWTHAMTDDVNDATRGKGA